MSSGPCVLLALEAPDAIRQWRLTQQAAQVSGEYINRVAFGQLGQVGANVALNGRK